MENIKELFDAALRDEYSQWHAIDWHAVESFVGKAQARIAQAEREKDFRRVKRLQRSLIRSWQAKVSRIAVMEPGMFGVMEPVSGC